MTFKSVMSTVGQGILTTGTVIHNSPIQTRIDEIDQEIEKLLEEKARLQDQLI